MTSPKPHAACALCGGTGKVPDLAAELAAVLPVPDPGTWELPGDRFDLPDGPDLAALLDPLAGEPLEVRLRARGEALAFDLDACHTPAADTLAAQLRGYLAALPEPATTTRSRKGRGRR